MIGNDEYLVLIDQGEMAWDGVQIKVFEITNRENLSLVPGNPGYDLFCVLQSDYIGLLNYNRYGDVSVYVEGDTAYIYGMTPDGDVQNGGILAYKLNYYRQ